MLKRTMAVTIAILIAVTVGPVAAQPCTLGVYSDTEGTANVVSPVVGETFDIHVVMFLEGLTNAVGYTLTVDGGVDLFAAGSSFGPDGGGLNFPNDPNDPVFSGQNVGLGACAIGFNGFPILVASYSFVATSPDAATTFGVTGNPRSSSLDTTLPVYSDCQGVVHTCDVGPSLTVEAPVDTESESFGAVKSLYRN